MGPAADAVVTVIEARPKSAHQRALTRVDGLDRLIGAMRVPRPIHPSRVWTAVSVTSHRCTR